eukprot:GHVL01025654.1.p1 GENE.GHVL01025654.1~~GHVL01025654.1.p1  ORF type:complete len:1179 (-),score=294.72 GHVL01025654.1:852-4388(-)
MLAIEFNEFNLEWISLAELLFALTDASLHEMQASSMSSPPYKRTRPTQKTVSLDTFSETVAINEKIENNETDKSWNYLLQSCMHSQLYNIKSLTCLSKSNICKCINTQSEEPQFLKKFAQSPPQGIVKQPPGVGDWVMHLQTPVSLFGEYLSDIFQQLHLLYEDLKLHNSMSIHLFPLACLLYPMSIRIDIPDYVNHYLLDFPVLSDEHTVKNKFPYIVAVLSNRVQPKIIVSKSETVKSQEQYLKIKKDLSTSPKGVLSCISSILQNKLNGESEYTCCINILFPLTSAIIGILSTIIPDISKIKLISNNKNINNINNNTQKCIKNLSFFYNNDIYIKEYNLINFFIKTGICKSNICHWPLSIRLLIYNNIKNITKNAKSNWSYNILKFLNRKDLIRLKINNVSIKKIFEFNEKNDETDETVIRDDPPDCVPDRLDPLQNTTWLYRIFNQDRRMHEVQRLLNYFKPVHIRRCKDASMSEEDWVVLQNRLLEMACQQQEAIPLGMGAFTIGSVRALGTERLPLRPICLQARFLPAPALVSPSLVAHPPTWDIWAEFLNGTSRALMLCEDDVNGIDRYWILAHRLSGVGGMPDNRQAGQQAEEIKAEKLKACHCYGGFLFGLGLRGHLAKLPMADTFMLLKERDEGIAVGLILGLGAVWRGSMREDLTRVFSVHIPSLLPKEFIDVDSSPLLQCSSIVALGLLYINSANLVIGDVLLTELGKRPSSVNDNTSGSGLDREAYSLSAAIALSLVYLKKGDYCSNLKTLRITEKLLKYANGETPDEIVNLTKFKPQTRNTFTRPSKCHVDGEDVKCNVWVYSPPAYLALGLIHLQSESKTLADALTVPLNSYRHVGSLSPLHAPLRIIARSLIMWNSIEPSFQFLNSNLPTDLYNLQNDYKIIEDFQNICTKKQKKKNQIIQVSDLHSVGLNDIVTDKINIRSSRNRDKKSINKSPSSELREDWKNLTVNSETVNSINSETVNSINSETDEHIKDISSDIQFKFENETDWYLATQLRMMILVGGILSVAIKYAGTENMKAKQLCLKLLEWIQGHPEGRSAVTALSCLRTRKSVARMKVDAISKDTAENLTILALSLIMAGSGDLQTLVKLRAIRKTRLPEMTRFGGHQMLHFGIGLLFMGGGAFSFCHDSVGVFASLMAVYPHVASTLTDNEPLAQVNIYICT